MICRFSRVFVIVGMFVAMENVMCKELVVVDRKGGVNTPQSGYVTVDLNEYANSDLGIEFPAKKIKVNNIPFNLVRRNGADNLFLKDASWAKVKEDPSSFCSEYDKIPTKKNPHRFIFSIPVADYAGVWILGSTDNDKALSDIMTVRIGAMGSWRHSDQVLSYNYEVKVPRFNAPEKGSVVKLENGKKKLFLVYVPIEEAFSQDFAHRFSLDVDITKKLRLAIRKPDPCRFQVRPLGLPSGVHIFGMTFALSQLQVKIKSEALGAIYNYPQSPIYKIAIDMPFKYRVPTRHNIIIEAVATDYYGNVSKTVKSIKITKLIEQSRHLTCELPVGTGGKLGFYELKINIKHGNNKISRKTTFAILPPDTREYRDEGFLGTWSFDNHCFNAYAPELIGNLYYKAGLRYGMFHYTEQERRKYNVIKGNERKFRRFDKAEEEMLIKDIKNPETAKIERFMIFHESSISGSHVIRIPDLFSGQTYKLDKEEKKTFSDRWKKAERGIRFIKKHLPGTEIYFGNSDPMLIEEFLRNKFPAELLGSVGCEAGSGMRIPESQPPDWIASNPEIWMNRELLDHYGYKDTPLRLSYEWCYLNTSPGNLSLKTQAAYYIRHIMHALAWKIPIIRPACIADSGDSYYFSNWGASGLCFANPKITPKPSYVAFANLTQILDGAVFTRMVETGSSVVYAVEFKKKDNSYVTCLWTIRGKAKVTLKMKGRKSINIMDMMGNSQEKATLNGDASIAISREPLYVITSSPIISVGTEPSIVNNSRPKGKVFKISSLDRLLDWNVEKGANKELEKYNPICPRRKGEFKYSDVKDFEGEKNVIEIKSKTPVAGSPYLPMYSVLALNKGVGIPGIPTKVGLMVNGNGGWGRFIFEFEDAGGQRFISIGAENKGKPTRWMADRLSKEEFKKMKTSNMGDWNTNDSWKKSYVNFEGWRYLEFPLPGNYPGEKYHWPYSSQWRCSGDGIVKYPLTFKKLIVTMPEKILKLTQYKKVKRDAIYIKDLMVTYETPEKAFIAE